MCDDDGSCDCDDGWTGELCDQEVCPSNCSSNGECDLELGECICNDFYTGKIINSVCARLFVHLCMHICVCIFGCVCAYGCACIHLCFCV